MRAGGLRQRLQLQSPSTTPDGMGGFTGAWTTVATVWGQVAPVAGAERLQGEQMTPILTHEIVIRYRSGVVPKMRIVRQETGGQTFEIHAIQNPDFRNRQLVLACSELQSTGA